MRPRFGLFFGMFRTLALRRLWVVKPAPILIVSIVQHSRIFQILKKVEKHPGGILLIERNVKKLKNGHPEISR